MFNVFRQPENNCIRNLALAGFLILMFLGQTVYADNHRFHAKVVSVSDGDSVRVVDEYGQKHKIRLSYIDAPELNQAGGHESRQTLYHLVYRENVLVEVFDIDRYKRKVAKISIDGEDINLKQIQTGQAWHYQSIAKKQQNPSDYRLYQQAQQNSQNARLGLWKNRKAIAPWQFRQQQRKQH